MVGPDGATDFFAIHAALTAQKAPDAILYAFDLLHLYAENLRSRPLIERRAVLADVLITAGPSLHLSENVQGSGPAMLKAAGEMGAGSSSPSASPSPAPRQADASPTSGTRLHAVAEHLDHSYQVVTQLISRGDASDDDVRFCGDQVS